MKESSDDEMKTPFPLARTDALVVKELANETLVYDLERHKAHCLNQTAALIWNHCDGKTSIGELGSVVEKEMGSAIGEEGVWFALEQLKKSKLLVELVARPADVPKLTRRELMTRIGVAASIPLVVSILAPTAAAGTSCTSVPCLFPTEDAKCINLGCSRCSAAGFCE
jgi:hypothetical protein